MDKHTLFHGRFYNRIDVQIEVYLNVTVVIGDSGTGKTFLFNTMYTMERINEESKYRFFNLDKKVDIQTLKDIKSKIIFIDNADIVLDTKLRKYISLDESNYYVIFGRDNSYLGTGPWNLARFIYKDNKIAFEYPFIKCYVS